MQRNFQIHTHAQRVAAVCLTLLLLVAQASAQNLNKQIVGGERAGPFLIGAQFSVVEKQLGKPGSVTPTSGDPTTTMRLYPEKQLGFLVNGKGEVIGITVARKDWKAARGLGVGSPVLAFQEVFGQSLKRGSGQLAFPEAGLAVTHRGGTVTTIYVVKKDQVDKVKGDHLVVGGSRVGQLRLGRSSDELLKLLGAPAKKEGQGGNIWVYPDKGVRLAFLQGRLHLVGVTSGDWVTPSGLKVGRPFSDMKRELGSDYRVETSSVFYDKWGIGARLQGDQIVEILVFSPRKPEQRG
jgi:hypothetical protein